MAFAQSKLEELFPFAWVLFASDVSEVFVCKGHFIEASGPVGAGGARVWPGMVKITQ